jgi:hypothetical protein
MISTPSRYLPSSLFPFGLVYMERWPFRFDGKINTVAVRLK